jgi:L-ascorbate metabolism protein UlaG (beta-lactamase superfamily)
MDLIARFHAPQIALLPIGGHFTMAPPEATAAARVLGVETVIPIHYGTFPVLAGTPGELQAELTGTGIEVVAPAIGETLT